MTFSSVSVFFVSQSDCGSAFTTFRRATIESPYQSPKPYDLPIQIEKTVAPYSAANSAKICFRWLLVCGLAAAPSFVLGLTLDGSSTGAIVGMICGVTCFVVGYTALEHVLFVRKLLAQKVFRRTAQIGYGTRIGLSILFPIGFYLDMFVGIISVPVGQSILQLFGAENSLGNRGGAGDFFSHFVLTIVQGACLNMILLVYMLIVFLIVRAVIGNPARSMQPIS